MFDVSEKTLNGVCRVTLFVRSRDYQMNLTPSIITSDNLMRIETSVFLSHAGRVSRRIKTERVRD